MSFADDDKWQRDVRDHVLAPNFYGAHDISLDGRYVFIDKGRLATILQKRWAVDTFLQSRNGAALSIEEKIVRWKGIHYWSVCLETESCTVAGHESPGWMRYGMADLLLYGLMKRDHLVIYIWEFPKLQQWFWPLEDTFPTFYMERTDNHSRGRLVPIKAINDAVPCFHQGEVYLAPSDPSYSRLFPQELVEPSFLRYG